MTTPPSTLIDELATRDASFEHAAPGEVLAWTLARFAGDVAMACSFVDEVARAWDLNLVRTVPGPAAAYAPCGTEGCCELRKVEPLARALAGRGAWITALKRVDGPTRASSRVLSWDEKFGLVKVNPLATWSDDDVAYYLSSHALPEHPLWSRGYASIGCAAVTVKPTDPRDRRSGRWAGADQEECGLHET